MKKISCVAHNFNIILKCEAADDGLFASVLHNGNHVLAQLLPPIKETPYQLRPRAHNRSLPIADTLMRKNFIERMLYKDFYWSSLISATYNINYNKKQDCLSRVVMVTDEKPQILKCNIQFYFKWIVQTITFKLCDKTQFKCNGLFYWFEIELNITI